MVDINLSAFIVLGLLVVLNYVLSRVLYRPVLSNLLKRREFIRDTHETARNNFETADSILMENRKTLDDARLLSEIRIKKTANKAERIQEQVLDNARVESEETIQRFKEGLKKRQLVEKAAMRLETEKLQKLLKNKVLPVIILCLSLLISGPVIASSSGDSHHDSDGHHSTSISGDLEKAFNFTILVIVLFFVLRKPASSFFQSRTKTIKRGLISCKKELEKSNKKLQVAKRRTISSDEDLAIIVEKGVQRNEGVEKEFEQKTQKQLTEIKRVERYRKQEMEKAAFDSLHGSFITDAMDLLEEELSRGIDLNVDKQLIAEGLENLDSYIRNRV